MDNNYNANEIKINGFGKTAEFELVAPKLWLVRNCFDPETFEWLQQITLNTDNQFQVTRPHHRLNLTAGKDYGLLQQLALDLIPTLNTVTGQDLNLMICKYWLDLPDFGCQIHGDAKDILVTFQCYIKGTSNTAGAEFLHCDPSIEVPIIPNLGYINLNSDQKPHQVSRSDGIRQSVSFQYNQNHFN